LPATVECPSTRNAVTDKIKTTLLSRQSISAVSLHYAAQCSISPRFAGGDGAALRPYPPELPPPVAVDLVFVRPHDFRLALISRFKHFQQRRVS
jgi:hypothetical protein